jgi:membrane protease YdiL (CAAX protease family)
VKRRNVVLFSVVVLAIGWFGHGIDLLLGEEGPETPGLALWIAVPVLLSLLLRAFAGDGWRDLGLAPRLQGNGAGYLVSIAIYPAVAVVVLVVGRALGSVSFAGFSGDGAGRYLATFGAALLPMFLKNIFEEFAWRGYLTPKLRALGVHDLTNHLITGLVWGLWHLPYFLFFLERTEIESYTSLGLIPFTLVGIVTMVAWGFVFGELRLLTGSIWPAVLMHMIEDALLNPLLMDGYVEITPAWEWMVSPGVGLLNILLFLGVGAGLYRYRKGRQGNFVEEGPPSLRDAGRARP